MVERVDKNKINSAQKKTSTENNRKLINLKSYPKVLYVKSTASTRLQAIFLGHKARKNLRVKSLANGLISVCACGDRSFFEKIRLQDAFIGVDINKNIQQQLAYIAVNKDYFKGSVFAHAAHAINPTQLNRTEVDVLTKTIGRAFVCINGGFFNHHHLALTEAAAHASIGKCINHEGKEMPHLPIPDEYKANYKQISFEDGSMLETAPLLSCHGIPTFTEDTLLDPKYNHDQNTPIDAQPIIPGHLKHASARHPRAGISLPSIGTLGGWVRIVAGLDKDRRPPAENHISDTGYTLPAWSKIMARIDRLEVPANSSINLDGGGSVAMVAITSDDQKTSYAQYTNGRPTGNLIGFVEKMVNEKTAPQFLV